MASAGVRNAANTPSGAAALSETHRHEDPQDSRAVESICRPARTCLSAQARKYRKGRRVAGVRPGDQPILQFPEGHEGTERREPPGRLRPRCVLRVATKATCVDPWIWLSMNETGCACCARRQSRNRCLGRQKGRYPCRAAQRSEIRLVRSRNERLAFPGEELKRIFRADDF